MICNVNLTVEYKLGKLRLSVFNAMLRVRDDIGGHIVRPGEYPQGGQTEPGGQTRSCILRTPEDVLLLVECPTMQRSDKFCWAPFDSISDRELVIGVVLVRQSTSEQIDLKIRC